jgi:predicted nuclease with TOPRIM domain
MSSVRVLEQENARLRAKMAKQRNEISRLTQKLESVTSDKMALLNDVKWMRGDDEVNRG